MQLRIYLSKTTIDTEFKTVPKNQCKINNYGSKSSKIKSIFKILVQARLV